jgi:hypothetical protein
MHLRGTCKGNHEGLKFQQHSSGKAVPPVLVLYYYCEPPSQVIQVDYVHVAMCITIARRIILIALL